MNSRILYDRIKTLNGESFTFLYRTLRSFLPVQLRPIRSLYSPSGQSKTEINQIQASVARDQISSLHCVTSMIDIACALGNGGTVIKCSSFPLLLLLLLLFYYFICTRSSIITEALVIPSSKTLNLILISSRFCVGTRAFQ